MKTRSIPLSILFTVITLGIYGLYWMYKITGETHELLGRKTTASGGMVILFSIITCGIYDIYWMYKIAGSLKEATAARSLRVSEYLAPICVALTVVTLAVSSYTVGLDDLTWMVLCGIGLVPYALIQDSLNDIIEHDSHNLIS